jgi:DNA-binding NarL/FixJ family response regulator
VDPLRVVIADDHPLFRDGLRLLLASVSQTEVVGEAATGAEVVELAAAVQPDVVVMDIHMPGVNGIEATRRIVGTSPHVAVLVLTMFEDDASVFAAMRAGASGYLLKGAEQAEIVRAIQAVASGEAIFGPTIARRVLDYFSAPQIRGPAQVFPELTDREREVLDLIARGESNTAMAKRLTLSPKTIRNHVSNIFSKLQVADRSQAIVRARQAGLGDETPRPG